eukprot:CAMPEP_0115318310 /NCGR_PEP_ID=MMETSP0270-20121206/79137_1 /TAXON_ID=71861 /ORGANISM="Scrippsiella trochoidea, Strain CCMP3099" /LENGTH=38 /DNA_ID= /DNA_START= /DNA_END= /DNA_ORIENTATION=
MASASAAAAAIVAQRGAGSEAKTRGSATKVVTVAPALP